MSRTMNFTEIIEFINKEYLPFVYKSMVWNHHKCLDKNLPKDVIRIIDEYQFDDEWWVDRFIETAGNHWEKWSDDDDEIGFNAYDYLKVRFGNKVNIDFSATCKMLSVIQDHMSEFDESWSKMLMPEWYFPTNLFNTFVYCHIKLTDFDTLKSLATAEY